MKEAENEIENFGFSQFERKYIENEVEELEMNI